MYTYLEHPRIENIEELYSRALMKWGWSWLPGTPPDSCLETFQKFKDALLKDEKLYTKVIDELN